jgi:hypothetical protein
MNYPVIPDTCSSILQQHSAAVVWLLLNHATPKPPPEDGESLKGPGDPAAVVSAARHRCQVRCLNSPTVQPFSRHQRIFCRESLGSQQESKYQNGTLDSNQPEIDHESQKQPTVSSWVPPFRRSFPAVT